MLTFLTGYLFHKIGAFGMATAIWGAHWRVLMFLNVWLVIWLEIGKLLGMKEGDDPAAAARQDPTTPTPCFCPMLLGMSVPTYRCNLTQVGSSNLMGLFVMGIIVV